MLVIDIETLANADAQPPEFSAPANLKDPEKIKAAIEQKRIDWLADGALHADRGNVAIVGWRDGCINGLEDGAEPDILANTWKLIKEETPIVGFNLVRFDIPFLIRRSWILGVPVPRDVVFDRRGYINQDRFIDLMLMWQCGDRQEYISLDAMARAVLGRGKTGKGADFGNLWATDRQAAIEYCKADVRLTWDLAQRLIPENQK
jgi:hypothetical protein